MTDVGGATEGIVEATNVGGEKGSNPWPQEDKVDGTTQRKTQENHSECKSSHCTWNKFIT